MNLKKSPLLKGKRVFFATFSMWSSGKRMPTNGNVEPFRDYLLSKKVSELLMLDQPVPSSDRVMPIVEEYSNGVKKISGKNISWWLYSLYPLLNYFNKNGTRLIFKIRDLLSVIDLGFRSEVAFDYFIGLESVNCLAGLILKHFGKVNTVIYYVLDFSPNRYPNKIINRFYLYLDRLCAEKADYIWDVSKEFQKARLENGLEKERSATLVHVPIGLFKYQIITEKNKKQSHNLVFVGSLGDENGPDLAIKTLSKVIKAYPDARLHMIGGGEKLIKELKALAKSLKVSDKVKFYGFVESVRDMVDIIKKFDIALAPYKEIPGSIRYYADSSKIRTYAGAGLPVITTNVPPLGRQLAEMGGALIAKDNETSFAKAVGSIFTDRKLYSNMREKVMRFSKDNTWDNEFDKAFERMSKN